MRPHRKTSQCVARPSSASGGSSTVPSPTAWRKPAISYSRLHNCRRANGAARGPRMRSNDCMRSSSVGSKRRPSCHQQRLPPCCSGRCLLPAKSTCEKSTAGRHSLKTLSLSQLTLLPETVASCYWRPRYQIPTAFRTAPQTTGFPAWIWSHNVQTYSS